MSRIIDKRPNGRHKSALNRQRFMRRFKTQIQQAVRQAIATRSIKQIEKKGEKITIPAKDTAEPSFGYGEGGVKRIILPGNKEFRPGDRIQRPNKSATTSGGATGEGDEEARDDFIFEISKEEFLDIFFEDLALPNLIKTQLTKTSTTKSIRIGFTASGTPANISVIRTLRGALGRKIALGGAKKRRIEQLEEEVEILRNTSPSSLKIAELLEQITQLKKEISAIPFLDLIDLKYHHRVIQNIPSTQAVMFCIMDVSGSMDESKKDIAKRFFILLYLFLNKTYHNVDIVFIRHHTSAKEVNEEEFFYSRETGGTVVSSALELVRDIIKKRYASSQWNIYIAQASDGDNWNNDSPRCRDILLNDILPLVQYFAYIEIMPRHHQSLWEAYLSIKTQIPHFAMQNIESQQDIYPVFRELFKKTGN